MIRKHSHVKIGRYHQVQALGDGEVGQGVESGLHVTESDLACFSWNPEQVPG